MSERRPRPPGVLPTGLRAFFGILPPRLPLSRIAIEAGAAPLPDEVTLVLDGAGSAAIAVRPGEAVVTGQDLARPGCGPLVSTVTGRVVRVGRHAGAAGDDDASVTIAVDAREVLAADLHPLDDLEAMAPGELCAALCRAGLPGLGALRRGRRITALVASALDEAPGCVVHGGLLRRRGDALAAAIRLWQRATGAGSAVLAVPADEATPPDLPKEVRVVRAPALYPNGLPEILALRAGGWRVQETPAGPRGDTLVVGLATLLAGLDCLREGRPLCDTTVSCLGPEDRQPRNLRVRIGTPAAQLLDLLGLTAVDGGKLVLGNPFREFACPDPGRPIRPDTHQLILQDPGQVHRFQNQTCTNCGSCTEICPVGLEVHLLGRFAEYDRFDRCADLSVESCVGCGLCAWVCPAHRPLAQLMLHAQQTLWRSPERRATPLDAGGCTACGPGCPAVRLFELDIDVEPGRGETRT